MRSREGQSRVDDGGQRALRGETELGIDLKDDRVFGFDDVDRVVDIDLKDGEKNERRREETESQHPLIPAAPRWKMAKGWETKTDPHVLDEGVEHDLGSVEDGLLVLWVGVAGLLDGRRPGLAETIVRHQRGDRGIVLRDADHRRATQRRDISQTRRRKGERRRRLRTRGRRERKDEGRTLLLAALIQSVASMKSGEVGIGEGAADMVELVYAGVERARKGDVERKSERWWWSVDQVRRWPLDIAHRGEDVSSAADLLDPAWARAIREASRLKGGLPDELSLRLADQSHRPARPSSEPAA